MLQTSRKAKRKPGFSDYLNFAFMAAPGLLVGKTGTLTALYSFSPSDSESSSDYDKEHIAEVINNRLREFSGEWMIQVDLLRRRSSKYSLTGDFPDEITKNIESERRSLLQSQGFQYENSHLLYLTYMPPSAKKQRVESSITGIKSGFDAQLREFTERCNRLESDLSSLKIKRITTHSELQESGNELTYDDFLTEIRAAISFDSFPHLLSPCPMYLDVVLAHQDIELGETHLKYGEKYISVLSIDGFSFSHSHPMMLERLSQLDMEFRWNSRFICHDKLHALSEIKKYRKKWSQQIISFKDQLLNNTNARVNQDAMARAEEADDGLAQLNSGSVAYGAFTGAFVLTRDDLDSLRRDIKDLSSALRQLGFEPRTERMNLMEAYLGSLPSHYMYNLRRPLINSRNFADFIPLSGIYRGEKFNPSPRFPKGSPALCMMLGRDGQTLHFNFHENDVGHSIVVGPTGTGKSYFIALVAAQFARYKGAKVFIFDKDYSALALSLACGSHYEISPDAKFSMAPFTGLNSPGGIAWAKGWILDILTLQGVADDPKIKNEVEEAVRLTVSCEHPSLSFFYHHVTSHEIKDALKPYLKDGPLGSILDSTEDVRSDKWLQCFELAELLKIGGENQNDKFFIPFLTLAFRKIEESLDGSPTLIIIDEAWMALAHKVFAAKVGKWLDTLRKANASVILATTSIHHFLDSDISSTIMTSCPKKIFLPNTQAGAEGIKRQYKAFGLNDIQIDLIRTAKEYSEYYLLSPKGGRLFQTGTGPLHLAFLGSSSKDDTKRIKELYKAYGDGWTDYWIKERC